MYLSLIITHNSSFYIPAKPDARSVHSGHTNHLSVPTDRDVGFLFTWAGDAPELLRCWTRRDSPGRLAGELVCSENHQSQDVLEEVLERRQGDVSWYGDGGVVKPISWQGVADPSAHPSQTELSSCSTRRRRKRIASKSCGFRLAKEAEQCMRRGAFNPKVRFTHRQCLGCFI